MLTLRRSGPREEELLLSAGARPVLLATLDVPFAEEATAFAVDTAVESGQPLVVVNAAEILPTTWSLLGYGYIEREDLQDELRQPAQLAHSLAVHVERLRVCSPHPVDALLEVVAERRPGVLVFGPERSRMRPRTYERAARRIRERATCLVWTATDTALESVELASPRRGPRVLVTSVLRRKT
jgi:nucleotide-binding universal stress UspA family protein